MKKHLLMAEFMRTPWALHPAMLSTMQTVLSNWADGRAAGADVMAGIDADKQTREARRNQAATASAGSIAVLPLYGVITQRGNMADDLSGSGSASTQRFSAALADALADPAVGAILIDIDSPGGSVYGVAELAAQIMDARSQKPIIGIANSLAASAAYWIGAACSELYCTPGGEVGSIGVYTAHADHSVQLENDGVKITLISAGKYKTEGNPYAPLDAEAHASVKYSVDNYYAMFTKDVSKGRNVSVGQVRDGMGQGRCLSADDALAAGMVDGIASFEQVIQKMQKQQKANAKSVGKTGGAQAPSRLAAAVREMNIMGEA